MKIHKLEIKTFLDSHRVLLSVFFALLIPLSYIVWVHCTGTTVSLKTGEEFGKKYWWFLIAYPVFIGFIPSLIEIKGKDLEQIILRRKQKERLSVLSYFSPRKYESLSGRTSIYNAIISSLERACDCVASKEMLKARFLLCSPALDYPERVDHNHYDKWGEEFSSLLGKLAADNHAEIDLTFLPKETRVGDHPLDDFLQVLASYCESHKNNKESFDNIYEKILYSTNIITDDIINKSKTKRFNITVRQDVYNIPFQIVLFLSESCKEVTVTFAGHDILEDVKSGEPTGFFSNDPYVVEIFMKIYDEYVSTRRRKPFTPKHTLNVIRKQESEISSYKINNYLGLDININIFPGVFSPLYGNSSKFTSWVLAKTIGVNMSVLDIGSGTGIQAIVAGYVLQSLQQGKNSEVDVYAIEAVGSAYKNLLENIKFNKLNVQAHHAALTAVTNMGEEILAYQLINEDEKEQIKEQLHDIKGINVLRCDEQIINAKIVEVDENNQLKADSKDIFKDKKFDIVIADLPFVDARPHREEERAFLDLAHREHETLFCGIKNGNWLKKGGKIITSLSSLGGTNDVIFFERLLTKFELKIMQKFYFNEDNYMWIVYVLMRYSEAPNSYWLDYLNVKKNNDTINEQ